MGRKILVVDDDPATVEALQKVLSLRGYTVEGLSDSETALSHVSEEVGLVLLDLSMPGLDGIEFCRKMKATPQGRKIPVVFLTGKDPMEGEWAALQAGAAVYLKKPVKLARLLEVIVEQFGLSEREVDSLLAEFKIKRDKKPSAQ